MRGSDAVQVRGKRRKARAVILIGFMGAGKSTVGRALSERFGWAFEDLDDRIEQRERRKVAEIFRDSGEAAFRDAEHEALKELLMQPGDGADKVVALGGGAFSQRNNSELIEASRAVTVFLDAGAEELWRRCRLQGEAEGRERPLLGSLENFRGLYAARRRHYLKASLRQDTVGRTVEQIVAALVEELGTPSREKRGQKQ